MHAIKSVAPVVIPTLCRYEHFKRCVKSLAECPLADQTELVIGLDYPTKESHKEGYIRIKEYIPLITGFAKVTVLRAAKNLGVIGNTNRLKEYVLAKYDRYIYSEDDNEFSPCFLQFMNLALDKYKDNERITSVCAYTNPQYSEKNISENVIFIYDSSAWGIGLWKSKEESYGRQCVNFNKTVRKVSVQLKLLKNYPMLLRSVLEMLSSGNNYGDARRSALNIINNTFQVRPYKSMVRNWGHDGSGEHCGNQRERFEKVALLNDKSFVLYDTPNVARTKILDKTVFRNMMPEKNINKIKIYLGIMYGMIKCSITRAFL